MLLLQIAALLLASTGPSAVEISPSHPVAPNHSVQTLPLSLPGQQYVQQGNRYYYQGELTKAVQSYERAVKTAKDATALDARLNGGVVLEELGQLRKAVDWFAQASSLAPKNPRVLTALGWAEYYNKDFKAAENHFHAALIYNPKEIFALLGLGKVEMHLQHYRDAAARFSYAADLSPNLNAAYFWKAQALEADHDIGGAIMAHKKAIANDNYFVEARYALGRLFMRYGIYDEAAAQFTRVIDADPHSKILQDLKLRLQGFVARRIGDGGGARRLFKRAPQIFMPEHGSIPILRVGIGTTPLGKPIPRYALEFECTTPFSIKDSKTGAVLASGGNKEKWHVHFVTQQPMHFEILNPDYRKVASTRHTIRIDPQIELGGAVILYDLPQIHSHPWNGPSHKILRGEIELSIHPNARSFKMVNIVDLESYTHGVISAEMPISSPLESLKAQSVVARSNALYLKTFIHRHRKDGYDICDGEHCQVYSGVNSESERSRIVVEATRGRIIAFHGKVAQGIYSSNCGGHTQSGGEVKGWGEVEYWKGIPDLPPGAQPYPSSPWELHWWLRDTPPAYCMTSAAVYPSHYRWTRIVPAQALEEKLNRNEQIGRLLGIRTLKRSTSGHLNSVLILGSRKNVTIIHEIHIRNLLGIASERSALFSVETENGSDSRPETFIFYGGGWGHGVGMCQSGAMGRAEQGQSYVDILKAYYQNTELGDLRY